MKRNLDDLNLRDAFAQEPDACHLALMQAACSVKEDEPVKKYTFRTALVAALIIAALMTVAIAATTGGLTDWFQKHYNAVLPQTAQEILNATEKSTLDAGPVTFTVSELLCDGKIAYLTVEAQLKEDGSAILCPDACDPYDRIGDALATKLNHPEIDAATTYLDAAKITGLPLYNIAAWMEMDSPNSMGEEMLDGYTNERGNATLVRMLYFTEMLSADELPARVVVSCMELDTETLEFVEETRQKNEILRTIPIHGVVAEKTYLPKEEVTLSDCFTLTGVTAKQTSAGAYVYIKVKPDEPMSLHELFEINDEWSVLDANGQRFPTGLSLTGEYLDGDDRVLHTQDRASEQHDAFQYMMMITVDELPESMIVTDGSVQIPVQ